MSNPMPERRIAFVTVVVRSYDEAIDWYRDKLGFELIEDRPLGDGKRWVVVGPQGGHGPCLLLAQARGARQEEAIGDQAGGRVFLFLHTDNFRRDYHAMKARGVEFREVPREESYGIVAVFSDLCGNLWDLLQPTERNE